MNEIIKAMKERRSIRKFKAELPSKADLEQMVEAGLYAANGMGKQATKIIVVTNRELRDKISEMNRKIGGWDEGFDPSYGAPAMLIVLSEKDWRNKVYDGSLVMGNLMLASHSLGLGSIWIHRAKEEFESDEGKDILKQLGIEGEWEGIGHCALGYMDGELPKPAPRKEDRVVWAE
ncbi:nitroreductase family protein [Treponema sp.]|uniref:nitroreductase family protein n=1 Tax=Treponema sp. TaxID=166 RepID=UPI00389042B4